MHNGKFLSGAAIIAIAFMGLFSCKKSSSTSTTPTSTATGKLFYCKIGGGNSFAPSGARYLAIPTGFMIVGDNADTTLEIHLSSDAVGTYTLTNNTSGEFGSVYYNSPTRAYVSTAGEVKITKSSGGLISGTFHYTTSGTGSTTGTVEVTDGEFNDLPKK